MSRNKQARTASCQKVTASMLWPAGKENTPSFAQDSIGSSECDEPVGAAKFGLSVKGQSDIQNALSIIQKKRVLTPDWVTHDISQSKAEPTEFVEDLVKMADIHFELEVIERRIEYGIDTVHGHPALAVQTREEEGVKDFTRKEKRLRSNYNHIEPEQIVPTFWIPRVWDDPESLLDEKQTEILKEKMLAKNDSQSNMITRTRSWNTDNHNYIKTYYDSSDSESDIIIKPKYVPPPPLLDENGNVIKRKRGRPRKNPLPTQLQTSTEGILPNVKNVIFIPSKKMLNKNDPTVEISISSFLTDDEHTDWEDL